MSKILCIFKHDVKRKVQLLVKTHISFFMISLKYIIKMFRIPSYQNKLVMVLGQHERWVECNLRNAFFSTFLLYLIIFEVEHTKRLQYAPTSKNHQTWQKYWTKWRKKPLSQVVINPLLLNWYFQKPCTYVPGSITKINACNKKT